MLNAFKTFLLLSDDFVMSCFNDPKTQCDSILHTFTVVSCESNQK